MRGFVDLHCHWIAHIDDGVRSPQEGVELLRRLYDAGFSTVLATPHMRPGMFDNTRADLVRAFAAMHPFLTAFGETLPDVHLASEHFFDDVVFRRLLQGEALPYPGNRAALIEFAPTGPSAFVQARLFDLKRAGITPVIAHPERYQPVWKDTSCLEPLFDAGAHLLLDLCALLGKYGRAAQRAAEKLLEEDAYEAACSDAHRADDVDLVRRSIERLEQLVGEGERDRLLRDGPQGLLAL